MRCKLYDYQEKATKDLLEKMKIMQQSWHEHNQYSSTALTAPTGAGKTVIFASVLEKIFYKCDDVNIFNNSTILWVSDNPSLNEQTKIRFLEKSNLSQADMVILDRNFAKTHEKLSGKKIYFLNRQKLSGILGNPDEGGRTFWDVLSNTINDSNINLYMIIDEAHKGLGKSNENSIINSSENKTIYAKLIDGQEGLNPPIPVVLGISATIKRWDDAMDKRHYRSNGPNIIVSNEDVRNSGIIKKEIEIRYPENTFNAKEQDLYMACQKLKEFTIHWENYCNKSGEPRVIPLLVVQVEDKISNDGLFELCQYISRSLPELDKKTAFANVFGEHVGINNSIFNIPYVYPEHVQENTNIRILFAKDAISTGWDCPRAEVLYSRRTRKDKTYIHQMFGRMIRTPLGHKIDSDDFLNKVVCYLPEYDSESVDMVVKLIQEGDWGSIGEIEFGDKEASWYTIIRNNRNNTNLPQMTIEEDDKIKNCFNNITSSFVEKINKNKFHKFFNIVNFLVSVEDPVSKQHWEDDTEIKNDFCKTIEDAIFKNREDFIETYNSLITRRQMIRQVELYKKETSKDNDNKTSELNITVESIKNICSPEFQNNWYIKICNTFGNSDYIEYYFDQITKDKDNPKFENVINRLGTVISCESIMNDLESWAETRIQRYIDKHDRNKSRLTYQQQLEWEKIINNIQEKTEKNMSVPLDSVIQNDKFDAYKKHLIATSDGFAYLNLNNIEKHIVNKEVFEPSVASALAWYRNPSHVCNRSLSIPRKLADGTYTNFFPDFIFFERTNNGDIIPYIVDPHGNWLSDSVSRLQGYIEYLKKFGTSFGKVFAVAEVNGEYRYLDLKNPSVAKAIEDFKELSAESLFAGNLSRIY